MTDSQAPEPPLPRTQRHSSLSSSEGLRLESHHPGPRPLRSKSFLTCPFTSPLPKLTCATVPSPDPVAQTLQSLACNLQARHTSQCQAVRSCRSRYPAATTTTLIPPSSIRGRHGRCEPSSVWCGAPTPHGKPLPVCHLQNIHLPQRSSRYLIHGKSPTSPYERHESGLTTRTDAGDSHHTSRQLGLSPFV